MDRQAKGPYAVDLGISADEKLFTGGGLKSLWLDMLDYVASRPDQAQALTKLTSDLQTLSEKRSQDPSVRTAHAIASSVTGSSEPLDQLVQQILAGQILRTPSIDQSGTNTKTSIRANTNSNSTQDSNAKSDKVVQAGKKSEDGVTSTCVSIVGWRVRHP